MRRRDVDSVGRLVSPRIVAVGALLATLFGGPAWAQDEMPPGHPDVEDDSNPHAHANGGEGIPGMFQAPQDSETPDAKLPAGTIVVDLRDPDDKPVPGEVVTLGALTNSIAKGDSRKHFQATTDAAGRVTFSSLETASNVAYRVSSGFQGGAFAATPFQLKQAGSMRVVLHVYPVARDIRDARVVCEATVAAEIKDDRIRIEEAITVYNLGRTAWAPLDVHMSLPDGYTGFSNQASMSDQGVDDATGSAKLRGTFPPGRSSVDFQWQLPWSGDKDVDFDVGLPPHSAIVRVMMPASGPIKLMASGFPAADVRRDAQGQSFLVTERRLRPDEPAFDTVTVGLRDLPTNGAGRLVASTLAAGCVVFGLGLVLRRKGKAEPSPEDGRRAKDALLEELADLEAAKGRGEVGPQTYQRARKEIVENLARALMTQRSA